MPDLGKCIFSVWAYIIPNRILYVMWNSIPDLPKGRIHTDERGP